jgi:hypothetical protein
MAVERPPSAISFKLRIKMQHYSATSRQSAPSASASSRRSYVIEVFLVVDGQYGSGGRCIGDIRGQAAASAFGFIATGG